MTVTWCSIAVNNVRRSECSAFYFIYEPHYAPAEIGPSIASYVALVWREVQMSDQDVYHSDLCRVHVDISTMSISSGMDDMLTNKHVLPTRVRVEY